jgi:hypothetical protein
MDAVWREVEDIIHAYGGFLLEFRTIDGGYIPFEREPTPLL